MFLMEPCIVSAICRFFCFFLNDCRCKNVARDIGSVAHRSFAVDGSRSSTRLDSQGESNCSFLINQRHRRKPGSGSFWTRGYSTGLWLERLQRILQIQMVQNQKLFVFVIPQCESKTTIRSLRMRLKKQMNIYQSYCLSRKGRSRCHGLWERWVVPLGRQIVVCGVVVIFLSVWISCTICVLINVCKIWKSQPWNYRLTD